MTERWADSSDLSSAQRAALHHVEQSAERRQAVARARLAVILRDAGCTEEMYAEAMRSVRRHARIALHVHPDRFGLRPMIVAESLLEDGQYRNQFETGLSSGGLTAFPGGERDRWEKDLFGGAYHRSGVGAGERPKYGALALIRHPDGPTPRFGSCYFVLRASVSGRASFTFSGSEQELSIERAGTIDKMDCVMAALLAEVASGKGTAVPWPPFVAPTLGVADLTVARLLELLCRDLPLPQPDPAAAQAGRVLDTCVEAQVHGGIDLRRDAECLVIDPAFEGGPVGEILKEVCRRYEIPYRWHCGFSLPVEAVPDDFRGPTMPCLARRIAGDGSVDAAVIGAAASTLYLHPERWCDWGSREETLQHLKQLWHVVVHYGTPVRRPSG